MLRVAIIGTGNIAHSHVKAFLGFPTRCQIVALVDIYPDKARAFARQYGLDVPVFDAHTALLSDHPVDLVSICTPPYTHAPIALDFLRREVHTIVEKPMAASLEECDLLVKVAQESRCVFSPIAQNRFRTPIMRLKSLLDGGLAGPIHHVQVDSFWWRGHSYYDLWWRGTWEKEGGGCTLNHAVHHIDLMSWLLGMPEQVIAMMANTAHDNAEVEDLSIAVLKFAQGTLGQLTSSVVHHGEEQQLVFQGQNARISVPFRVVASQSQGNGFPQKDPDLEARIAAAHDSLPELAFEAHAGQIDNVFTAIETGTAPLVRAEDGRRTLQVITAVYKAASAGGLVTLPIGPGDPFYTAEGMQKNAIHFYEKTVSKTSLSSDAITTGNDYQTIYNYGTKSS